MKSRIALVMAAIALIAILYWLGVGKYLSLDGLQAGYRELQANYRATPIAFVATFMAVQITALALCIPGAVLTPALAGGALFGPAWGTLIVLSSLTIGDSLGFLAGRHLLRDWVRRRFAAQMRIVDREVSRDGAFYLLALRLMAVMPYFVVNLTIALTRMRLRVFAPVSFIGLAPATVIYVNAGTALAAIDDPGDILSLRTIVSLAALGLMPIVAKIAYNGWRARSPVDTVS